MGWGSSVLLEGCKVSVGVVIGVFGDRDVWLPRAQHAYDTLSNQTVEPFDAIISYHPDSLGQARNDGAEQVDTDWLIFLDADDTLDERYVEEMSVPGRSTIRQPSTLGVYPDGSEDDAPNLIPKRDLNTSNYLVIGSMCLHCEFDAVGGFDPTLPVLEDWDLWRKMWKNGAKIGARPKAIYRVGVNQDSRNSQQDLHNRIYRQIRKR